MNSHFENNMFEDNNIDMKRYLSMFISNWYWFAGALFIAVCIAYGINRYSEKVYTVSSTLLIKDDQIGGAYKGMESVIPGGDIFRNQQNLNNEVGILKSFSLNYQTIKQLKEFQIVYVGVGKRGIVEGRMYKTCPFKVVYDSLTRQPNLRVNVKLLSDNNLRIEINGNKDIKDEISFGKKYTGSGFNITIEPRFPWRKFNASELSSSYYFYFTDPESLANQYSAGLYVAPIEKGASLVVLSKSGFVPEQESDYLNKLMEVYKKYGLGIKNETASRTIEFINEQLGIISDSLTVAEGKLESFRLANNFFELTSEGTRIQNKLGNFENERNTFKLQLQYYNYLSEYLNIENPDSKIISPAVLGVTDQVLLRLVNELSVLQSEIEKLGFNFDPNQPNFILLKNQIDEKRGELRENIRNCMATIRLSIEETDKSIAKVEVEINKLPTTERKLIGIQRKFDLNNTVYTYLLEKRAESSIAKASNVSDNRTIDYALPNNAALIKPKSRLNLIMAITMGLLIPLVWIVIVDFLNNKVIDKRDVEKKTKVPILGFISHNDKKYRIPVVEKPGSSFAESFRSVRTAIKFMIPGNIKPVIAISSTVSSEGKTFISINLAAIVAMLGKRVLLVGLDLRKPRIDSSFDFEESPGMSSYLSGNCEYKEVIKATQIDNLFYAPAGPIPPNPAELLEGIKMKEFIEKAKGEYDYIIIDTPPIAIVTDTLLLTPLIDLNLFVVRQRYTSRDTLEIIDQLYRKNEMKKMAIIINDINLTGYYGYGMRYGYAMGYGYSYGHNYYGNNYYSRYGDSDKGKEYYTDEV